MGRRAHVLRAHFHQSRSRQGTQNCVGNYEYAPDGSWKGSGTCTNTYKDGDKLYESWEEGSYLKVAPANIRAPAAVAPTSTRT